MTEARQRKCARCKGTGAIKDVGLVPITCPVCSGKGWNRMR
jgi:DnaJ-class molecular chaperone